MIQILLREKCLYSEFFWSVFSCILYSVQMRENTDQKNSEYGHFSRSVLRVTFPKRLKHFYQDHTQNTWTLAEKLTLTFCLFIAFKSSTLIYQLSIKNTLIIDLC